MKYTFEAFDTAGNLVKGEVEAASTEEARAVVSSQGATPYEVRASGAADFLFREVRLGSGGAKVGDAHLGRLMRDLAILLQAGVPLDAALRIASTTAEHPRVRSVALQMMEGVLEGSSLAEIMHSMGGTFRAEYVKIMQAGEIGADLGGAAQEVADLLDRQVEVRARVRAALAYPALLVGLAAVSLWIVLGLLVPAVTPIFLENGTPLPAVIALLDWLRSNSLKIFAALAFVLSALVLALMAARQNRVMRITLDKLYLSLPIVGRISELREAARFTRTLASLIRAGVPPLQAFQAAGPLVKNWHTREQLNRVLAEIRAGARIGVAMARFSVLPPVAQQMIAVGEESGRLQDMLLRATLILERQEQTRTAQTLAVLSPTVTILVAGMIAAVILTVMGAILSISELALR